MDGKIVGKEGLRRELDAARARGEKAVFTNGCFDLLHAGHVRYLSEARALGDLLVVAINTDRSVSAIKPGRPLVPQSERAEVLAALSSVDYVTAFDEETPYGLIEYLRPDVLVKGGDWRRQEIVGSDLVPDTRSLPYHEGLSTSALIERIKDLP